MIPKLTKTLAGLLLGTALAAQAAVHVGVDPAKPWLGFMNWWDLPAEGGALAGQSFWGPADLGAQFAGSTLTLTPNTSVDRDAPTDPYWWKADGSSNKILGANLFVVDDALAGQHIVFSGTTTSNTLDGAYRSNAFVRAFNADFSVMFASIDVPLVHGQPFRVEYLSSADDVHIEYGFDTIGPAARIGDALGSVVIATVPEPAAWASMAAGLLLLAARHRRAGR
jgi:hypothetical protein